MDSELVFLKLGGSLITDKASPHTPQIIVIQRLAREIAEAVKNKEGLRLLVGHGSGSFGHAEAARWRTADGVRAPPEWAGFSDVWRAADTLNRLVMDALAEAGLQVIRIAASGAALAEKRELVEFPIDTVQRSLLAGLIPVVYGDVVFDRDQGGAIASTEAIFSLLARACSPRRILLAGMEGGVYEDFPGRQHLLPLIRMNDPSIEGGAITGSAHVDVTGGMHTKVDSMRRLIRAGCVEEALIFSGREAGRVRCALMDQTVEGTYMRK